MKTTLANILSFLGLFLCVALPTCLSQSGSSINAMAPLHLPLTVKFIPTNVVAPVRPPRALVNTSEFIGVTSDPATMEFLSAHRVPNIVGSIKATANNSQQLWIGSRMLFEAKSISEVRSSSQNNIVALAAVTELPAGIDLSDSPDISKYPASIWLIDGSNVSTRISPATVDARLPLISDGGDRVAFTASLAAGVGMPVLPYLFVVNLKTGQYRVFQDARASDHAAISPAEWTDGGKTLRVLEDHGETGGNMVMRQISMD